MSSLQPDKNFSRVTRRCSYCGEAFPVLDSRHLPFCSRRCQQLDLGNWLSESYGLPIESGPDHGQQDRDDPDEF